VLLESLAFSLHVQASSAPLSEAALRAFLLRCFEMATPSPNSTQVVIDDATPGIGYSANWLPTSGQSQQYGGTAHTATADGAIMSVPFSGTLGH
jgi:hypothetical protein